MESRKVLKERMRIVCCLCYGKGEYPEKEVMWIVEVTTRWRERSPRAHLLCLNHEKDPQPENLGTLKLSSSSSLVGSLSLPFLLYLRFRRSSHYRQGWPSAHGAGG